MVKSTTLSKFQQDMQAEREADNRPTYRSFGDIHEAIKASLTAQSTFAEIVDVIRTEIDGDGIGLSEQEIHSMAQRLQVSLAEAAPAPSPLAQLAERFVRECGWAYDVTRMLPGHPLTRLAELAHKADPWLTYQDLMAYLGIRGQGNMDRWRERGLIPHKRRAKSGPGRRIVVRGRDFPAIKAAIEEARAAAREASRARFTAMRRGQLERAS